MGARKTCCRTTRFRIGLAALLLSVLAPWQAHGADAARHLPAAQYGPDPAQTLTLHLPATAAPQRPLVVFVPGGFWSADARFALPPTALAKLLEHGVAVAEVQTRSAPAHTHPAQVRDLAAAVAWLRDHDRQYGYSRAGIYLVGHSSGGHLAALLALDPQYLRAQHMQPKDLAGVVPISAIFDVSDRAIDNPDQRSLYLRAFGEDDRLRRAASPVTHVNDDSPPFLVLSAADDLPGLSVAARRFTMALRAAGNRHAFYHIINRNQHLSMLDLAGSDEAGLRYFLAFSGIDAGSEFFSSRNQARHLWHDPPVSTAGFWQQPDLVHSYPVDQALVQRLVGFMQGNAYMLSAWPLREYHAIALQDWLNAQPKARIGSGKWLITENLRGEKLYWNLDRIAPYEPVIVVGLDDEKNLFRLTTFYRTNQEYSWIDGQPRPPLMVRPLGAFLHFRKPPPDELRPRFFADYSLGTDSFHLVDQDPLASVRNIPASLWPVFTYENGCVSCHSFRDVHAQAHHVEAMSLQPHGGNALPLTSYAPEVWRAFMFEQERVAKKIGVVPNPVRKELAPLLFELVQQQRASQVSSNSAH